MLSFEEILRICRIMAGLGIRKIKVTGGEPLVRRGISSLFSNLKKIPGIESVTLTTNGFLLGKFLDEVLVSSSLPDGINISLDTLDPERFRRITRTRELCPGDIFPAIDSLLERHIPVKINCVPVRDCNEDDIVPLTALARDKKIFVRFIELMPLGSASAFEPVSASEVIALIEKAYGSLIPVSGIYGNGPAVYFCLPGFSGKIGFINAMSHGFCETCNRLRLTSEGMLRPCLSSSLELDLRSLLRSGAGDDELVKAITQIAGKKPRFHSFSGTPAQNEGQYTGGMFRIGG